MGTTRFIILLYIFCFIKRIKLFKVALRWVVFISKELYPIIIVFITIGINVN